MVSTVCDFALMDILDKVTSKILKHDENQVKVKICKVMAWLFKPMNGPKSNVYGGSHVEVYIQ